jgi:hypothetical protein
MTVAAWLVRQVLTTASKTRDKSRKKKQERKDSSRQRLKEYLKIVQVKKVLALQPSNHTISRSELSPCTNVENTLGFRQEDIASRNKLGDRLMIEHP